MNNHWGRILLGLGIILLAVGTMLAFRPSIASGFIWFLGAGIFLATAAFLTKSRIRLTSIAIAVLSLVACLQIVRERNRYAAQVERDLARLAKVQPLALSHNVVGASAQEIEGTSLFGQSMRLSEHRGKVVLLVFWGSRCGPCLGDVPHEKDLVERFAGRPFVLVGVNCDETIQDGRAAVQEHAISWESFWNGGSKGVITSPWGIRALPTTFIIDDTGIIRHQMLRRDELDAPLEKLIAIAESRASTAPANRGRTSSYPHR